MYISNIAFILLALMYLEFSDFCDVIAVFLLNQSSDSFRLVTEQLGHLYNVQAQN